MAYHCVVTGCSNGAYRLRKWKEELCNEHDCKRKDVNCSCPAPFKMYPFPTEKKNPEARSSWIKLVNRLEAGSKNKFFIPSKDSRVCSKHFKDGEPTEQNPYPSEYLGYDSKRKLKFVSPVLERKRNRKAFDVEPSDELFLPSVSSPTSLSGIVSTPPPPTSSISSPNSHHQLDKVLYFLALLLSVILFLLKKCSELQHELIQLNGHNEKLKRKVGNLYREISQLKKNKKIVIQNKSLQTKNMVYTSLITSDKKCNFYTNMQSCAIFDAIYETVKPFVYPSMSKVVERTKSPRRTLKKRGPVRKLNMKDEFLLTLMKLRLGLLFGDLGDRFGISLGTASRIFSTWIKATSLCLKSII